MAQVHDGFKGAAHKNPMAALIRMKHVIRGFISSM
jgi:hypothetical protein